MEEQERENREKRSSHPTRGFVPGSNKVTRKLTPGHKGPGSDRGGTRGKRGWNLLSPPLANNPRLPLNGVVWEMGVAKEVIGWADEARRCGQPWTWGWQVGGIQVVRRGVSQVRDPIGGGPPLSTLRASTPYRTFTVCVNKDENDNQLSVPSPVVILVKAVVTNLASDQHTSSCCKFYTTAAASVLKSFLTHWPYSGSCSSTSQIRRSERKPKRRNESRAQICSSGSSKVLCLAF